MVNLRYLVSVFKTIIYGNTDTATKRIMFLNKADIDFLESHRCLISISQLSNYSNSSLPEDETSQKYEVDLNFNSILQLCN